MADRYVGLETSKWLINNYQEDLSLLVTVSENEIYQEAKRANAPCITSSSTSSIYKYLEENNIHVDQGFLIWWPKLVKPPLLNLPKYGFINSHPSLLPYNRGKHPNFWALVEQVPFGVSFHIVDEGIDSGAIIASKRISYNWEDTGGSLYYKAIDATIELFKEIYPEIRKMNVSPLEQDSQKSTFHMAKEIDQASKIELDQQYIARDLINLLRARTFPGQPGCRFVDEGEEFEIRIEITKRPQK